MQLYNVGQRPHRCPTFQHRIIGIVAYAQCRWRNQPSECRAQRKETCPTYRAESLIPATHTVPKPLLGNAVMEAPASYRFRKLELPLVGSQAGAWEPAQQPRLFCPPKDTQSADTANAKTFGNPARPCVVE